MRLKRWESPRQEGRNDKGRGGSARQRQLKKQQQMLRKRLKEGSKLEKDNQADSRKQGKKKKQRQGEENLIFPLIFSFLSKDNIVCHGRLHKVSKLNDK
ncbi:MAG: hypothetical protein KME49_33625 [Brasilonema octagenarum HA4186-MV1]|uniref:Uncharacterized protein n=2 Tax=Octagenarum group TaxID=3398494 RepID=A0ABX1M4X2_9CYAN|nr:hypothetical protein [Brasilonema octagenarum HA4186-MV1]NMF62235.1 hypothetical protein [Brasilonema octagenarum UFV-OR1]